MMMSKYMFNEYIKFPQKHVVVMNYVDQGSRPFNGLNYFRVIFYSASVQSTLLLKSQVLSFI